VHAQSPSCCGDVTIVGTAALAVVSGWVIATVLPPKPNAASLAGITVGIAAVAAETMLIGGMAAGLVALPGIAGGVAAQRIWLGAVRTWAGATPREGSA
jgi:hypothetical protein